jgi:MarR family transcriptional regulator, organic hydroperoxide resistance regulator
MSRRATRRYRTAPSANGTISDAERVAGQLDAIARALRESTRELAQDLPRRLTPPQVRVMEVLVDGARKNPTADGVSLSELSARVGLAHSTVSGIIDRLERADLVHRTTRPDDRRYVWIQITAPVRDWLQQELPALRIRPLVAALDQASEEERAALTGSLALLQRRLELQSGSQRASAR